MSDKHRIVLVEDHALLRAAFRALLSEYPDVDVVGEADNGRDALKVIGTTQPDLVLLDITMPGTDGIEALTEVKRRHPNVRILILTIHKTDDYIGRSLAAGADGYILKGAAPEELRLAIDTILGGKRYLTPDVAERVINGYLGGRRENQVETGWSKLTRRERQVLKLVAEGHRNKAIAEYLCLSVKTVEKHRANLMGKLDIHNASRLTGFAIQQGLLAN